MANIKDFIKKIGNETVSLEEQQKALAAVEKTIVEAKAKREESIGKNVDLVIAALKKIETDLNTKLIELNNTPAKQGVAGPKGEKGRDGRDGKDGYKGQDGKDGIDGKDGKDGNDGISVVDAKVDFDGSLVITLSDGREIDAGTVLSVDAAKHIHSVQTGGTGSTSQAVLDAIAAIQATIATYGTMAKQNANSVAITGGTIDNAVIGGTTPAAGTFTTITGQTEVLKGTGSNLALYSQDYTNAAWTKGNITATASGATAPDGTTTAITILETVANSTHNLSATTAITSVSGANYTISAYVKANGRNYCALYEGVSGKGKFFNITAGGGGSVLGNLVAAPVSAALTYVGSDWYRVSIVVSAGGTVNPNIYLSTDGTTFSYAGNASLGIYAWGMQVEIGSTLNTYVSTTTTAVYGTPTLSFSGVAGLGLQSDGSLYVSPAGTGAIQAQATTSSTVGGNARGANAVDWSTIRTGAGQVASGSYAVLGGGWANTNSGYAGSVLGGLNNQVSNAYSVSVGGYNNNTSGFYSSIVGGSVNTSAGYYNFIGGGFTNSGTSGSAVTTQSGTMNGTTAVTLSGSNASIKVGQYITGTSIASDTYVAAISGTALTLSKNASGSSTSTLSFYTPHGVVVGGGNNQATGSYSFIGGGGDAGTSGNRNVASGDWSVVAGGFKNTATNNFASINGGYNNTATNTYASINGGQNNTASNSYSSINGGVSNTSSGYGSAVGGGYNNLANQTFSTVVGGSFGNTRSISGNIVFPACDSPISGSSGLTQAALLILAAQTTDATATLLTSNSVKTGNGGNQVILPNNSAYYFTGEIVSGVTGGGNSKGWTISGLIKRGANAASTALVGSTVTSLYADAGAATWTIGLTADTTNGGLAVTFTGQAGTTIRTVCSIRTVEMTY